MRWIKIVCMVLVVGIIALALVYFYPYVAPLVAHRPTKGLVNALLDELLAPHKKSPFEQYWGLWCNGTGKWFRE